MKRYLPWLTPLSIALIAIILIGHGPVLQFPDYHEFADRRSFFGINNGLDVLSNVGFAVVALWGLACLFPRRHHPSLAAGWPGYALFLSALLLTAFGSSYYHLAPDNLRLVFDRIPIALACAGLLAAVYSELRPNINACKISGALGTLAIASVFWWFFSGTAGEGGDLRPYLLIQGAPLLLIPFWQAIYGASRADRLAFGTALGCYMAAKAAEYYDHALLQTLGAISGHSLKHLLASVAAAVIVMRLAARVRTMRPETKNGTRTLHAAASGQR